GSVPNEIPCPDCGKTVSENARFCPFCGHQQLVTEQCAHCGKNLPPQARFCPRCGEAAQTEKKAGFCSQCGAENMPGAVFCNQCGERMPG
ncbi:MAG: double zinc ribbon domain-containing protein, partial [Desulfovibrionales bacterium]